MESKQCFDCLEVKSIDNFSFYRNKRGNTEKKHYNKRCKPCHALYYKEKDVKDKIGLTSLICRKCNAEKALGEFFKGRNECKDCSEKFKEENKDKIKKGLQRYYIENRDYVLERCKKSPYRNSEKEKETKKRYRKKNLDKRRKYEREWKKRKIDSDPNFKIKCSLRTAFRRALKSGHKYKSVLKLVGCSIEEFRTHIEKQFQPGMTWENWGKGDNYWNLDHIDPLRNYNMLILEEQQKCWHYTNFRPLWEKDNLRKSDWLPCGKRARHIKNLNQNPDLSVIEEITDEKGQA